MPDLTVRSKAGMAVFSADHRHRYLLTRDYDSGAGICCFVLLNPSRADAETDDPTITRCSGFARRWGYAALLVVNLFDYMSSDPRMLADIGRTTTSKSDKYVLAAVSSADLVVVGWGVHGALFGRSQSMRRLLREAGIDLWAFGITQNGEPRHPLYLPYSSTLSPFE
jgi:hypothetical protein